MEKLKELRLERRLSQEQLALKADFAQPQISDWESGRKLPTIRTLKRLAKALGVKPAELL